MHDERRDSSDRRGFFRSAMSKALGPIGDYLDRRLPQKPARVLLRPPGATHEATLLEVCYRCGTCVEACPADSIYLLDRSHGNATGTPVIDPDRTPCVVCDGLHCANTCSSGALLPLGDALQIRMGRAEVYESLCLRTQDKDCTLCVERCPIGETALRFSGAGAPEVLAECVGCGVCQHTCPTTPKAIVVKAH